MIERELDHYGAMCLFRLISDAFIADEDAWAICKLSELSSLPVSESRLCFQIDISGVHQLAIPPVYPTLTCLHNLNSLHNQGTGT